MPDTTIGRAISWQQVVGDVILRFLEFSRKLCSFKVVKGAVSPISDVTLNSRKKKNLHGRNR